MKLYTDEELAAILDQELFHQISAAADRLGVECYVVGGYVRDIFLERPSNDIDVVVVGSGIAVAQELKKHIPNYDKTEIFFNKTHIYRELKEKGDMMRAIELSRELDKLHETDPEVYKSYTQMYKLFDIIREITK